VARPATTARVLRLVRSAPPDLEEKPSSSSSPTTPAVGLDDTELLAALRRGDPSVATALYRRTRPQVNRTIIHLLGPRDPDHEDLVQLSMIELVGSLGRFRGECSLDTWTSRITAHAVYKELRRRRSAGRLLADARDIELTGPQSADVERKLSARAVMARVQQHIDSLDPVKAWTLLLHEVCGYDLREIAEITESTVAAAQSRLVRGRAELHARIESDPELADALERRRSREEEDSLR
jgi:RNA polymerase sigma-70 factor (ECF subfamily)